MSVETMFSGSLRLHDDFQSPENAKYFDLHRKHFLYGKIDPQGDAIVLKAEDALEQVYTGNDETEFAVDFVAAAFTDMRRYIEKVSSTSFVDKYGLYNSSIGVKKAFRSGDLEYSYYKHIFSVYTDFIENYLNNNRRYEKVSDFRTFMKEFMRYATQIAKQFPITKTGYILSNHSSPLISGLALEIAKKEHGVTNNENVDNYREDINYRFFVKTARKFGFMVDKTAPWRIVFNLKSGGSYDKYNKNLSQISDEAVIETEYLGAEKYLRQFGLEYGTVFDAYYDKAHLLEVESLRGYMLAFYQSFYERFREYVVIKYEMENRNWDAPPGTSGGQCYTTAIKKQYEERKALNQEQQEVFQDILSVYDEEYWMNIILKLRLIETATPHSHKEYMSLSKQAIKFKRALTLDAGLNFINNFTKGQKKTIFSREGKYWYGQSRKDYLHKKQQSFESFLSSDTNAEISGVKNKKRG
jgi:hypothetical protein